MPVAHRRAKFRSMHVITKNSRDKNRRLFRAFIILIILGYFYLASFWRQNVKSFGNIQERVKGPLKPDNKMLIKYVRDNFLRPPSTSDYNLNQNLNYRHYSKDLTWNFSHSNLKKLFSDEPPGFFVEAGALDGEMLSNTLWLEREKGWNGLLIEPDYVNYATLLTKNRKAWSAHACLATTPYPKMSTFSSYEAEFKKFDLNKDYDWLRRGLTFDYESGINIGNQSLLHRFYNNVQCFPLETFLLSLNVSVVDFLSLDIQGGEWKVLKWFPWKKIKLRTLCVEYIISAEKRKIVSEEFVHFMTSKGYTLMGVSNEPDYFFVANNDKLVHKF